MLAHRNNIQGKIKTMYAKGKVDIHTMKLSLQKKGENNASEIYVRGLPSKKGKALLMRTSLCTLSRKRDD